MSTQDTTAAITPEKQAEALALSLIGQCAGHPHNLALSALLSAYIGLASANPCCTQACANQAMQAAMHLARQAAQMRPDGAPVH